MWISVRTSYLGFRPKGRLIMSEIKETPYNCAVREFMEEVEVALPPPIFLSDTYLKEKFQSFNGRVIESRLWLYIIEMKWNYLLLSTTMKLIKENGSL